MTEAVQVVEKVPTVVGNKVVDMLTCCALFHSVDDLKAAQMNIKCSLI